MLYINDLNTQAKTYEEVVAAAIGNGVDAKRVFIYLAGLGVKGGLARTLYADGSGYGEPVKVAVKDNKLVTDVKVCKTCGSLVVK